MTYFELWLVLILCVEVAILLIALAWRFAKEWLLWPDTAIDPKHHKYWE